ncbi:MAG: LamG-like jellyroll fold domain-containing protein [Bacteroidota bacterium]
MKIITTIGICILSINIFAQMPSYVPQNGLVGWWPFNSNANDESGNGNNGFINGASLTTDRNGLSNKAFVFNGLNNWIEFGNILDISTQNAITISAWFKPSIIFDYLNTYTGLDFGKKTLGNLTLRVNEASKFQCLYTEPSPPGVHREYAVSDVTYNVDQWYHLVAIYKNGEVRLFVNSEEQFNTTSAGGMLNSIPSNAIFYVGKSFGDGNVEHFYNGSLDDIGIWNRELNKREIDLLFNSLSEDVFQYNKMQSQINIYPNPAKESITVVSYKSADFQFVEIYNINGLLVKTVLLNNNESNITINISEFESGLYIIKIKDSNEITCVKLVKLN